MSTRRNEEIALRGSTSSTEDGSYTPPPRNRRTSEIEDGNSSVSRLTDVMSNLLREIGIRRQPTMVSGDAVPSFNPEDGNQTIENWCIKVDELKEMFGWSEDLTIFHALSKLEGLANVWYKGLKTVKFSWDEWKHQLCRAFPSQRDYNDRLHEMMKRRKRPEETFARYFYEKQALLNACRISGRDAVSCIIGGICENHIKSAARAGNYEDPEALFDYLRCLTDENRPLPENKSALSVGRKREYNHGSKSPNYHEGSKSEHQTQDRPIWDKICYTCREKGHIAPHCPKRSKNSHTAA